MLFPGEGYTKADVAEHYRRVADRLLPFLKDRPVTLERLPDGLGGRTRAQNARGHHAVPPSLLRSVPGATVSTPPRWAELTAGLDPGRFTIKTVPARLARQKADLTKWT